MSGGKKKSGFQITSVTSEFEKKNGTGELTRNDNLSPESNGPTMLLTPKLESTSPLNCYAGGPASRSASPGPVATATPDPSIATNATGAPQNRGAPRRTDRDGAGNSGQAEDSAAAGPQTQGLSKTKNNQKPTAGGYNGSAAPSLLCPRLAGKTLPCFSAPNTPTQARRGQPALPTAANEAAAASSPSSPPGTLLPPLALPLTSPTGCRFRLVKLDHGLREPYKRGRWSCVDFYDRDSLRHAHSLESLDGLGLASSAADSKRHHKPLFMTPTPNQHHLVHSQGTTHVLAPNPHPATPSRAPQNITPPRSPKGAASRGLWSPPTCLRSPVSLSLAGELINSTESKNVDQAERGRKSARMDCGSRSGSPAPPLVSAGSPGRRSLECRIHSPACFSFAQSMFGVGTSFDIDDEGGSGNSMVAIDNKIEQAMDLVKSHLMFAVREEVEVLKEQIKELAERNSVLERENSLLRAIASPEQLNQLQGERGSTIASPEQLNQLQGERGSTIASPEQLNQLQGERGSTIASPEQLNQLQGERGSTIASSEQLNQLQGERGSTIASPEQLNQLQGERGSTIASPEQLNQLQGERGSTIASPEQLNQLRGERGSTIASPEQLNQLQGERGSTIASPEQLNQLQGERGSTIASPEQLNQLQGERGSTIASPEQLNQLRGERGSTIASPEQLNQLRGERGSTIASPEQLNQLQGERGSTIASPEQLNQLQGERGSTIASPEQLNQLQGERGAETPRDSPKSNGNTTSNNNNNNNNNNNHNIDSSSSSSTAPLV